MPCLRNEVDNLPLPQLQILRGNHLQIAQHARQREPPRTGVAHHEVAPCAKIIHSVEIPRRLLREHEVADPLRPIVACAGRPSGELRTGGHAFGDDRHGVEAARPCDALAGELFVRTDEQQPPHAGVDRKFAAQVQHREPLFVGADTESGDALQWHLFLQVAHNRGRARAPFEFRLPVEAVDACHAIEHRQDLHQALAVVQRNALRRIALAMREDDRVRVVQIVERMDERPQCDRLPVAVRVVAERAQQVDDRARQQAFARPVQDLIADCIRPQHVVDEFDALPFADVPVEYVAGEIGDQRLADRRAREDEVEVGEEPLDARVLVAHRFHDVVPIARVDGARGARDARNDLRLEHVGRRERHAAHVHDVEDAVRARDVVGRDDDEHDVVDEVCGELSAFVVGHRGERVVRAPRVLLDVALCLRRDVRVAQVE